MRVCPRVILLAWLTALSGCYFLDRSGRGAGLDAGADSTVGCTGGCDDSFDCTLDECIDGTCRHAADDSLCPGAQRCDALSGCVSDVCDAFSCAPRNGCEIASCVGDDCVRTPSCGLDQMCCDGACVPLGCDDGNVCTDDLCGGDGVGCVHAPLSDLPCDDGTFCDGPDTCRDGTCAPSGAGPCPGVSECDEDLRTCTGCATDADCPATMVGPFGPCGGFADVCDESGRRFRTVSTFRCVPGSICERTDTPEGMDCARSTAGVSCGSTTLGLWNACGGFADACDESGTQSRTNTLQECSGGSCDSRMMMDTRPCARSTDGNRCNDFNPCTSTDACSMGICQGDLRTCDPGCMPVPSGGMCVCECTG